MSGREVAQLGPVRRNRWRRAADIADIFHGRSDSDWSLDRDLVKGEIQDPFQR